MEDHDTFYSTADLSKHNHPDMPLRFELLEDAPQDELDGMTVEGLRNLAGDEGIDLGKAAKKDTIITVIRKFRDYREVAAV